LEWEGDGFAWEMMGLCGFIWIYRKTQISPVKNYGFNQVTIEIKVSEKM
jgi:hypothetical protein